MKFSTLKDWKMGLRLKYNIKLVHLNTMLLPSVKQKKGEKVLFTRDLDKRDRERRKSGEVYMWATKADWDKEGQQRLKVEVETHHLLQFPLEFGCLWSVVPVVLYYNNTVDHHINHLIPS